VRRVKRKPVENDRKRKDARERWPPGVTQSAIRESASTAAARLEQGRGPFGLFGFQARYDWLVAILDLPAIGPNIVGPVENFLT